MESKPEWNIIARHLQKVISVTEAKLKGQKAKAEMCTDKVETSLAMEGISKAEHAINNLRKTLSNVAWLSSQDLDKDEGEGEEEDDRLDLHEQPLQTAATASVQETDGAKNKKPEEECQGNVSTSDNLPSERKAASTGPSSTVSEGDESDDDRSQPKKRREHRDEMRLPTTPIPR